MHLSHLFNHFMISLALELFWPYHIQGSNRDFQTLLHLLCLLLHILSRIRPGNHGVVEFPFAIVNKIFHILSSVLLYILTITTTTETPFMSDSTYSNPLIHLVPLSKQSSKLIVTLKHNFCLIDHFLLKKYNC